MQQSFPYFAKEGWVHIAIGFLLALIMTTFIGFSWGIVFWILFFFILQFFRDPPRKIPEKEGCVVCPAHGRVVYSGKSYDPYLKRESIKISIFMNVFSVHSNFSTSNGTIKKIWYYPGKFINAALDKASTENERNAVWLKTDKSEDIVFVQIAGLIARRIMCHINEGDKVFKGQRYGFIRFGSKVDVYLPADASSNVSIGDKVMSGNDIIAYLA